MLSPGGRGPGHWPGRRKECAVRHLRLADRYVLVCPGRAAVTGLGGRAPGPGSAVGPRGPGRERLIALPSPDGVDQVDGLAIPERSIARQSNEVGPGGGLDLIAVRGYGSERGGSDP